MSDNIKFGKWLSNPLPGEEVVITGISGRLPESHNIREFQENLFNKIDMVTDDTRRWSINHPEVPKRNAKIHDIDKLDAGFFGVHYRQADIMDPMMRKFLECATEAIMDAGLSPSELEGSQTAVFIGACYAESEQETLINIKVPQNFGVTGYLRSLIAHRISYFFKLKGTSVIVDTACSSSLNALELAFKYIREGKCENAIVGGGNVLLHPGFIRQFFKLGVLSTDGTCKVFDQRADGFARGEAVSCIFLQKAKNAKRIYAKIIHSKANSNGYTSSGITFPSPPVQEVLMRETMEESGINPSNISFIEAHGTATEVGDSQEVEAIDRAIAMKRKKPLLVGSVKSSVGHSEPASGLSSVIKVLIAMETGFIAPNIHLKNIKRGMLGIEEGRMKVVTELSKLDRDDAIIGINNFGFGGSNCHLLLQRFEKIKNNETNINDEVPYVVCASGRTKKAVLSLLRDVSEKRLDREYIGLLHQIFKRDIAGHVYRGFTIVSKHGAIKTDLKHAVTQKTLYVYFGKFEKGHKPLYQCLLKLPYFQTLLLRIKKMLDEDVISSDGFNKKVLDSFVVQIGIAEILKLVELKSTTIHNNTLVSQLVSAYNNGNFSLEKAIYLICKIAKGDQTSMTAEISTQLENPPSSKHENACFHATTYSNLNNCCILNISDDTINNKSLLCENNDDILEVLGRIYQKGYNPQLHKLYEPVNYPVTRSTPMISPLILWDYRKSWYVYKFGKISEKEVIQREHTITLSMYQEQRYNAGHVIDGRNLIPATGYLNMVRKTFMECCKMVDLNYIPMVFENCRFVKAVALPKSGAVTLLVSVQKCSGNFEVSEKNSVVVTGRIFVPTDIEEHQINLPIYNIPNERTQFLEQDEIYRELNLRGYNYSNIFKGIVKCSVDVSTALVKWENNWTTFLDKMLQLKILQTNTRSLYVPVGIQKISINPLKHSLFVEKEEEYLCPVYYYKNLDVIKSGGIEICGIQTTAILKKKSTIFPVLEKHIFVPNKAELSLEVSIRVITQIILENSLENNFKAVEIPDTCTKTEPVILSPLFFKALEDIPTVTINLTVSTKSMKYDSPGVKVEEITLTSKSNLLLIITKNVMQDPSLLKRILSALSPNGFFLTREEKNCVAENFENIEIITEHITDTEKLVLFRKTTKALSKELLEIVPNNFHWLPKFKKILKNDSDVIVYSQNLEPEGVLGLVNCIRREPKGNKVSCFLMMDNAPRFDSNDPFYKTQLRKQLAINVFKENAWGTYRHILLDDVLEVEGEHFFVQNTTKGDLSTLKWVKGSLTTKTKVDERHTLVFPFYSALNFRDVMVASGRVSVDNFTTNRIDQESCQGIEFSGRDINGRRVMAMTSGCALATMIVVNNNNLLEVPDNWSLEDASTVTVVYATVVYGLLKIAKLKPEMSVLIHSATGGIGLAALNVCTYYGCKIYVTVGTKEKRDYLKKHYPQILESHIGNSRDTSFEEMIKVETNGRGVDILLNSLSEEKLKASIRCVAPGGNFLEIGKYDMGNNASLNLLLLQRNVSYHGVMLDNIFEKSSKEKEWILNKIREGTKLGYVKPLPRTVFKQNEIVQAYKFMTTGKHIGKVAIQIRDENENCHNAISATFVGAPRFTSNSRMSYIILGGLGGIGLELVDWLYLRGAKNLILVSRLGIQTGYQELRLRQWKSCGVNVTISTKDITTKQGCLALINETIKIAPLEGIFNLAVILKDALFEDQSEEMFDISLGPKARATLHLDELTRRHCPQLKYFVTFSSVSCGRGNAGQTNYGMANSIMERICEKRKRDGLPGLAIQWGAIGDVGLVAKLQKENKELIIGGTLQQKISSCLEVLDKLLTQDNPVVSSMIVAKKIDTSDMKNAVNVVAYILGIKDVKAVGFHTSFAELGMDSMMGTEMIQILEKEFDIYLTANEVRNMTFAKLIELDDQQKTEKAPLSKTKKKTDLLLKYIPQKDLSDLPLVKISCEGKNTKNAQKTIFLPGIEGVFDVKEPFTTELKAHVIGLKYTCSCQNIGISIEDYAIKILPYIEEIVSKQGSFFIIAYSFGVLVAIELTILLEKKGFTGQLVAIEGSPFYCQAAIAKNFSTEDEDEFQTTLLFKTIELLLPTHQFLEHKDKYLKCENFDERFELLKSHVPSELLKEDDLEKKVLYALYDRLKWVCNYRFRHQRIKSRVCLFKAKFPMISDFARDYHLSELCEQPPQVIEVNSDHSTILSQHLLIDEVNKLLTL